MFTTNTPSQYDVVLGGQGIPKDAAVLGGIRRIEHILKSEESSKRSKLKALIQTTEDYKENPQKESILYDFLKSEDNMDLKKIAFFVLESFTKDQKCVTSSAIAVRRKLKHFQTEVRTVKGLSLETMYFLLDCFFEKCVKGEIPVHEGYKSPDLVRCIRSADGRWVCPRSLLHLVDIDYLVHMVSFHIGCQDRDYSDEEILRMIRCLMISNTFTDIHNYVPSIKAIVRMASKFKLNLGEIFIKIFNKNDRDFQSACLSHCVNGIPLAIKYGSWKI